MTNDQILESVQQYVQKEMEGVCSAHDFFHIERVVKLATQLQELEGSGDLLVIQLGAYMHESLDEKFFGDTNKEEKVEQLKQFLLTSGLEETKAEEVIFIMKNVGYGKSLERTKDFPYTKEFMIVEDADRLESVGAIAIARTFAYTGSKGRAIYDPARKPNDLDDHQGYLSNDNTAINHFYEKLLLLKDLMHTESAKNIASERHEYMQGFLKQFYQERNADIT